MVIFFTKEYFFLFNHFDHDLKDDNGSIFLELEINWKPKLVFFQMNLLNSEEHMCSTSTISRTCAVILWSLFFRWSHFLLSPYWMKSSLIIGKIRELNLESLRFSCLFKEFSSLILVTYLILRKFTNKGILIFSFLLTSNENFVYFRNLSTKEYLFLIRFLLWLFDLIYFAILNSIAFQNLLRVIFVCMPRA